MSMLARACRLFDAVDGNDFEGARKLLNKSCTLDECDESGSTALMWACYDQKLEIVELLLENGADVNIVSNTGDTALTIAIREGHVAIVEMLLEYGADTRVKNDRGENPLIMATRLKNTEIVNLLVLKQGVQFGTTESCVFLSHTGQDEKSRRFAAFLQDGLKEKNIPFFYDAVSIPYGVKWQEYIEIHVVHCTAFVAILSPRYFKRRWCMRELHLALRRGRPILPVFYELDGKGNLPQEVEAFCDHFRSNEEGKVEDRELKQWWINVHEKLPRIQGARLYSTRKDADVLLKCDIVEWLLSFFFPPKRMKREVMALTLLVLVLLALWAPYHSSISTCPESNLSSKAGIFRKVNRFTFGMKLG